MFEGSGLDLTVSERILIVLKAFAIAGRSMVTESDVFETLVISEDLLGNPSFSISYMGSSTPTAPVIEGSLDMLEKMALIERGNEGYVLTRRGEIFLSSKLSNIEALNFLRIAIEVAKLSDSRRRLYSLIAAYARSSPKNEHINTKLFDAMKGTYDKFKKDIKRTLLAVNSNFS